VSQKDQDTGLSWKDDVFGKKYFIQKL